MFYDVVDLNYNSMRSRVFCSFAHIVLLYYYKKRQFSTAYIFLFRIKANQRKLFNAHKGMRMTQKLCNII